MQQLTPVPETASVIPAAKGFRDLEWKLLGQTYVPKSVSEDCFSWHATFPAGTFVPPHIHPRQDEYIYVLEGRLDLFLDGKDGIAKTGDLVKMPMGLPHGIFNKSGADATCLFWVCPTRSLFELFQKLHALEKQTPEALAALSAQHEVDFLPAPG
jgi:oxalate decarboxylase/phosphoglucose isomerase-like protein (cupin superfamily)